MTFPWGKRRNTNGQADTTDSLTGLTTDRGYTEHEHLDEMGLIHMNGRVYDPLVGRMMSADPFIQAPGSLQSYNRYAYVMNNPLNLTDPSGYFSLRGFLKNPFKAFNSHGDRVGGAILGAPFGSRGYHAVFNFLQGSGGYQLKSAVISGLSIFCGYAVAACNGGGASRIGQGLWCKRLGCVQHWRGSCSIVWSIPGRWKFRRWKLLGTRCSGLRQCRRRWR